MTYIFLRHAFGKDGLKMVSDQMSENTPLLSVSRTGQHRIYDRSDSPNWRRISNNQADNDFFDCVSNQQINWGTRLYGSLATVNKADNVGHASHKGLCRRTLQDAGVKVPRTYFWSNLAECEEVTYPIIVRPSYHHGGQDFFVFDNPVDLAAHLTGKPLGSWYASELFQKTQEFRVHVAHGKVLVVQEKPLIEGEIRANYAINQEEWKVLKWREYHPGICREAIRGVEVLGLDFGAVDVMYNSPNDSFAICEVNTAPSIASPYMSQKYANYFDWLIRHSFPQHLPFDENGKNVFYSEMLRD